MLSKTKKEHPIEEQGKQTIRILKRIYERKKIEAKQA